MLSDATEPTRAEPPLRAVPADAGAIGGCPACGGPLYGWTQARAADARRAESYVLDRCERCGLAIVREGEIDLADLLSEARPSRDRSLALRLPNRRSLQAAIGEGRWAGLHVPELAFVATPAAATAMLERSGRRVARIRQPAFARNQLWMWQTLMNALTFHPNFAREALAGRLRPASGRGRLAFAIDALVSLLAAPVVALVSVPLETLAALARRGGELVAIAAPEAAQSIPATSSASSGDESQ